MEDKTRQELVGLYFESWLKTTPDFVFFKDLKGVYQEISNSIVPLVKAKNKEEVIGKNDDDIYSEAIAKSFKEQDKVVRETQINYFCEDWVNHETLGRILIETLKSPLYDEKGFLIGVQGVSRNITEKHNLQHNLRERDSLLTAIFKNIPGMIWVKDAKGKYIVTNKRYRDFYGIQDAKLHGEGVYNTLYTKDLTDNETIMKLKAMDEEVANTRQTAVFVMPANIKGTRRWVRVVKTPIILENGTFIGILGIGEDITERKNYEDIMEQAKKKAEEASCAKSDFLSNISHEIRTPMNGIMGFLQLLEATDLNEEQKDYISEIKKSSSLLLSLLNDILDLAKAEAGKLVLEETSFNLRDIVEDVTSLACASIKDDKDIEVVSFIDSKIQDYILGDPVKLKQILNNFISNAVKFTEKGEIRIFAQCQKTTENEVHVLFTVEDTGIGIKKENLEKIFETFTQEDESTTRKYGGTGLGLVIAKNIIKKMQGSLNVESTPNQGSSFMFEIKFKIDKDKFYEEHTEKVDFTGKTVMLVNDNPLNTSILRDYLQSAGAKVLEAGSQEAALGYLQSVGTINLVIVDFDLDGGCTDFAKKIQESVNLPVICTARRRQKAQVEALKGSNITDYLLKPFKKSALIEAARKTLNV